MARRPLLRRFGKAWQVLGLPFWVKPYACRLNEWADRIHWLAVDIDEHGATVEVMGFLCGVTCGWIQEKKP